MRALRRVFKIRRYLAFTPVPAGDGGKRRLVTLPLVVLLIPGSDANAVSNLCSFATRLAVMP